MFLKPLKPPEKGIKAGKFGCSGKMVIHPYAVPEEWRERMMVTFRRFADIQICGCWEWQGRIHNGYGVFPTSGSSLWAHRVAYALFNGPIEAGKHIDHKCRNRVCVRPDHLQMVSPIENYLAIQRRRLRDIKNMREEAGQMTLWRE